MLSGKMYHLHAARTRKKRRFGRIGRNPDTELAIVYQANSASRFGRQGKADNVIIVLDALATAGVIL
jgi:hypothetical protein